MRFLGRAEGEGFEPSRDETAPNGFRDRHEHAVLQGLCSPFASLFASHLHLTMGAFADMTTPLSESATPCQA